MQKPSAVYELNFLVACLETLEAYLQANEIYRTLSLRALPREKPYPQFTLGWMLLFQIRAQARAQTADQRFQIETISNKIDNIKTKWRSAWAIKASKEFSARLSLWRDFLVDFWSNPTGNIDRYDYEVNRRVLLELLRHETYHLPPAESDTLDGLDDLLKSIFVHGEFIWDEDLKGAFPEPIYWFLFGKPDTRIGI